jgi:rare lipoprotein A
MQASASCFSGRVAALVACFLVCGCAAQPAEQADQAPRIPQVVTTTTTPSAPEADTPSDAMEPVAYETGRATYYARKFQGHRTASGERYDMHAYSAAHRTLPFGSYVRVTSLSTGMSVIVRINDRGPFVKDRVIDLSLAAATLIHLRQTGSARVKLEPVSADEARKQAAAVGYKAPRAA